MTTDSHSISILSTFLALSVFLIGCLSVGSPADKKTLTRAFGPITFERTVGNTTYYRHIANYRDPESLHNPFVSIVSDNRLVKHARLNDVINEIVELEATHLLPESRFLTIDIYGVNLGDNIRDHEGLSPVNLSTETRLITYELLDAHGWDRFLLEATKSGTIEGIQLLKRFESSAAMHSFRFALQKLMVEKFTSFESSYSAESLNFRYTIYGVPNDQTFKARLSLLIDNELSMEKFEHMDFDSVPYLINSSLDRIQVFYVADKNTVWLSVNSKNIDQRIQSVSESILEGM